MNVFAHPLLSEISAFKSEITAIVDKITALDGKWVTDKAILDRIRELSVTWNSGLVNKLSAIGGNAVRNVGDTIELTARQTNKRLYKDQFRKPLKVILGLLDEIYLTIGKDVGKLFAEAPSARKIFEEIPDLSDDLIPKPLIGWSSSIKGFLKEHPFDQNIFIMVRYASESERVIQSVSEAVKSFELNDKRFFPVIAREHSLVDDLYNPIACLLCCRYGIAIFDSVPTQAEVNPNVAYELGFMHLLQRRCLILKEKNLRSLPTDILHKLYQSYASEDQITGKVQNWLEEITTD